LAGSAAPPGEVVSSPFISIIVPAYQGAEVLPRSLSALAESDLPRDRWELIVVDDGSTDQTATLAAEYADIVLRIPGKPHGPAYARNRGVEVSRGDLLIFVDADVAVHPETVSRFARVFMESPSLGAAFGSYDRRPTGAGIVSQYRNLLHHYVHQKGGGEAETFWAGCGAVRRDLFISVGMFDEWSYTRPQIEDIELGRRIRRRGARVVLHPEIQATHLKRWTLREVLTTDLHHRGIPWMRLLLQEGLSAAPETLNLGWRERWCTALAGSAMAALLAALVMRTLWPLGLSAAGIIGILVLNRGFYRFLRRRRGSRFLLTAFPLHLLYYGGNVLAAISGWILHHLQRTDRAAPGAAAREDAAGEWPPSRVRPSASLWDSASSTRFGGGDPG
jgi:GT2 family glycosyltransferase